ASNDSQNVINMKCVRSPSVRLRTITPWLPGVSRYSLSPDSLSTSRYASAFDAAVIPCHVRAIIAEPRSRMRVALKNPSPAKDGGPLLTWIAALKRTSLDDPPDPVPTDPQYECSVNRDA